MKTVAKVDISAVWDRATEFLGDNIAVLIPIAVPWIYLPVVGQGLIAPLAKASTQPVGSALQLAGFLVGLIGIWGQLQLLALALDPARGAPAAREAATSRLLPVLGITLLLAVAAALLVVPIAIALGAAGVDFQAVMRASEAGTPIPPPPGMTPRLAIFMLLYLVVLLVALLWISARLLLINAVVLAEGGFIGAIGRAFALTRGNALVLIGVLLLFVIVSFVATLAAQTVFGAIFALIFGNEGTLTLASALTVLVVAMVSTAFTALSAAFVGKFYVAARAREAIGSA